MGKEHLQIKEEVLSPLGYFNESSFEHQSFQPRTFRKLSSSSHESAGGNSNCSIAGNSDISGYGSEISFDFVEKQDVLLNNIGSTEISTVTKNLENNIRSDRQDKVNSILNMVQDLSDIEKLLLYLKLPTKEKDNSTALVSNSKQEQTDAFKWIRENLEECDTSVNLPKQEVYEQYKASCESNDKRWLSAPDFGKIVKCLYPNIKARRLGTRGNSKYCYTGLQMKSSTSSIKYEVSTPRNSFKTISQLDDPVNQIFGAACMIVCEWANKLLGRCFSTIVDLARFLVSGSYVSTKSIAALTLMAASQQHIDQIKERFSELSQPKNASKRNLSQQQHSKDKNYKTSLPPIKTHIKSVENSDDKTGHITGNKNAQVVPSCPDITSGSPQLPSNCSNNLPKDFSIKAEPHELTAVERDESLDNILDSLISSYDNTNDIKSILPPATVSKSINSPSVSNDVISSPSKRQKKKPEKLLMSNANHPGMFLNIIPVSAPPTVEKKTPKKVGRPRSRKNTPMNSPGSIKSPFNSPVQYKAVLPTFQPSPLGAQISRMENWPYHLQSPISHHGNISSPSDLELQSIFMQNGQKTPLNVNRFNVQRCQSVPVHPVRNQLNNVFQPLTPQVDRINQMKHFSNEHLHAKRNLSFMFNDIQSEAVIGPIVPNTQAFKEREVPNLPLEHNGAMSLNLSDQSHASFAEMSGNMYDLATPDELTDIPANPFEGHVDGETLLNNLQTSQNNWSNDWNKNAVPLMKLAS